MKTAFLFDGDFFLRRLRRKFPDQTPEQAISKLFEICNAHLDHFRRLPEHLYRVFFYDCPPLSKTVHLPMTKKSLNFKKTPLYEWRSAFQEALKIQRKVALRLGRLADKHGSWIIKPPVLKELLNGQKQFAELADEDFSYDVKQKGVDMRIALDIAAIASKKLADQIVLFAGDSDFVPAAKMARREGIDFVLDSMGAPIPADLHEHIDGLLTTVHDDSGTR